MGGERSTEAKLGLVFLAFSIGASAFLLTWMFVLEPPIETYLRARGVGHGSHSIIGDMAYAFLLGLMPPLVVIGIGFRFGYQRWYLSQRGKLARERLSRLGEARNALRSALSQIETFERDLREKTAQYERLEDEIAALRSLNAETSDELIKKLRAVELVNRRRIWVERVFSFMIGVASSLFASYAWQLARPTADLGFQVVPPVTITASTALSRRYHGSVSLNPHRSPVGPDE